MMWLRRYCCAVALVGATAMLAVAPGATQEMVAGDLDWEEVDGALVGEGVLDPAAADEETAPAAAMSTADQEELYHRYLALRERNLRRYAGPARAAADGAAVPDDDVAETEVVDAPGPLEGVDEFDDEVVNPGRLVIGRNSRNTQASLRGNSTLAEPAAANNGPLVFAAGNFAHAEYSANGGASWTNVTMPGGRAEAPTICCDHDVVIDDARRTVFHSTLYINSAVTNGNVRIFVRRPINTARERCSYIIDPGGRANNILPDYPHIGLTKRFLYLTINATGTGGGFARIYRFDLDAMDNCRAVPFRSFTQRSSTFGQRVWVPAEGTNNAEAMYWAQHDNASLMRIFRWDEDSNTPTAATVAVTTTNFTNPDCRGGIGNFDWIERGTAFSIAGFRTRCTLAAGARGGEGAFACYWNAGPTGSATQGHVRAAVFSLQAPVRLLAQPHIFNNGTCFGFPVVTANKRGDIGFSLAIGGRRGGGGSAVRGIVGIDDEFTPGLGTIARVFLTASGTANRSDNRFGDYFTIHPYEPCEKWFSATNYAWIPGRDGRVNGAEDVNYRYIEFGREQSRRCYNAHRDQIPVQ